MIEKYGFTAVALVSVALFVVFLVKFILKRQKKQDEKIDEIINKLLCQQITPTQEKLDDFAETANKIQILIYHMLMEFKADRISIYEYHNGGKTISGVDFKKCSNTYEAVDLQIEPMVKQYQNLPLSTNTFWYKLILDKKPIEIADSSLVEDNTMRNLLKTNYINSYYSRLLLDYDCRAIGFITIEYYNSTVTLTEAQKQVFSDTVIQISGLISNKD
jgi:hypothetical protein